MIQSGVYCYYNITVCVKLVIFGYPGFKSLHQPFNLKWYSNMPDEGDSAKDMFQPKTSTFSTCSLILVRFKTVHYFSQSIFSLFSYLNMHNPI